MQKAIVAFAMGVVGLLAQFGVDMGVSEQDVNLVVTAAFTILTAFGVWLVPNSGPTSS